MRVECLSINDTLTGESLERSPWLTVGKVYQVLSILVTSEGSLEYRLISDDNRTPGMYKASQFKLICNKLPSNWVAHYEVGSYFELAPKSWIEPGFWDSYFDGEPSAIKQFELERELMVQ